MRFLVAIADGLNRLKDIPPLLFRLILVKGFLGPFGMKWDHIDGFADFLASMNYPFPTVSAWIALICEGLGMLFLFFGFATRIITIPLMFLLVMAIATVHWQHGFSAADNGFEIPLYYLLFLFSLFITGPGKISLDGLFAGPVRAKKK